VVEDTDVTLKEIAALSPKVAALVDAVTRRPGETYETFVLRAGQDTEARAIKIADLADNVSRLDRLAQLDPAKATRLEVRYRRALAVLTSAD
jgi:(p)ppGpp synthase/HD superfamily hydrolase